MTPDPQKNYVISHIRKQTELELNSCFFLLCFRRFDLVDGDEVRTCVDEEETRSEVGSRFRYQINVAEAERHGGADEVLMSSNEGSKMMAKETRGFDRYGSEGLNGFETQN
jgi:hypothetical protein